MSAGWASAARSAAPLVSVSGGVIEGVVHERVVSYKGIPFAAPPLGLLRWRPPQPVIAWSGVRKADAYAIPCAQGNGTDPHPSDEDCLYLNVWTQTPTAHAKRAVMVWIHGGGFRTSATSEATFDGTRLAEQGVVLVSTAYRLGAFGFLAHPLLDQESGGTSGNYGIEDMIAALQWVRANIAKFGGDPHRVTIFGESAGGIAVSLLAGAPRAKGLYQRAISESGGAFAAPRDSVFSNEQSGPLQTLHLADQLGEQFFEALGAHDLAGARSLSTEAILKATRDRFWPVIDGQILPAPNAALYRAGRFNDTPILVGTNSDEALGSAPPELTAAMLREFVRSTACPQEAAAALDPPGADADPRRLFETDGRDGGFAWNTWSWARWQSRRGRGKVFLYYFDFPLARFPQGSPHWSEVPYVFGNFGWWDELQLPLRPEDLAASDLIRRYWVNFATSGNPNGPGLPVWPAFSETEQRAMVFGRMSGAQALPNLQRLRSFDAWYRCAWGANAF